MTVLPRSSPRAPLIDRLLARSSFDDDGHLIWTGYLTPWGPAMKVTVDGRRRVVSGRHVALEAAVGPAPAGCWAHSLCGVPRCVLAEHLEWTSERRRLIAPEVAQVLSLIRDDINVSDTADAFAVNESTLYRAMRQHDCR